MAVIEWLVLLSLLFGLTSTVRFVISLLWPQI